LKPKDNILKPVKVAVYGQAYKTESIHYISELIRLLKRNNCSVFLVDTLFHLIDKSLIKTLKSYKPDKVLDKSFDFLISVGGDGTMLRAATLIKDSNIPIIGINTGRLGFLATVQKDNLEQAITQLLAGNYSIIKRSLLEVTTDKAHTKIQVNFALNEVSVSRKNTMSMIMIDTHLNNQFLNTYWADGLIIATPTGSTGYSLSCNGPIITPQVEALTITPIAPHNLSIRPLVIRDDTEITLTINSREEEFLLSMDSRVISLSADTKVTIRKTRFQLQMIEFENQGFLKTLREKLLWGKDTRN